MRHVWVVCLLLLSGCTDDGGSETVTSPDPLEQGDNEAANATTPPPAPRSVVELVNETVTIAANACNPAGATEDVMHTFDIVNGTTDLEMLFTRVEQPQRLFATNIRVYPPGFDDVGRPDEQEAWSGEGTMEFSYPSPDRGTWTIRLLHCDVPGTGQHVIDSLITATVPE